VTLRGISVGSLELTPAFDPYVTEYTISWPNPGTQQTVTAEPANAGDEVIVWADFVSDGAMDIEGPPPKTYGGMDETPRDIHLSVSDGETEKRYKIHNTYYD